jgi:hypothetical protein
MREVPVEFTRALADAAGLQVAVLDAADRLDLGVIAVEKISSASSTSAGRMVRSCTVMPSRRRSSITRARVTPGRKVPFSAGVWTTPSFT